LGQCRPGLYPVGNASLTSSWSLLVTTAFQKCGTLSESARVSRCQCVRIRVWGTSYWLDLAPAPWPSSHAVVSTTLGSYCS
jgi:hypothetical protein